MHLEVVSESVVALAQARLTEPERHWLTKLLNIMQLKTQFEHYEKAGLSVEVLAVKEAVDLCAWGNEHNTNEREEHNTGMYTVGLCQTLIDRAVRLAGYAATARGSAVAAANAKGGPCPWVPPSGALLPPPPPWPMKN